MPAKEKKPAMPSVVPNDLPSKLKRHRIVEILAGIFVCFVLVLTVATAGFFTLAHGSLAQIYVGSAKVLASDNQQQMEQKIINSTKNYRLTLQYPDGSKKTFPPSATGVSISGSNSAQNAKQAINKSLIRRLQWWKPIHLPLSVQTNQTALQSFINTSATQTMQAPKNAILDASNGDAVLTPETNGQGATISNASWAIPNAVVNLRSAPLVLQNAVLQPSITVNDLKPSQQKVQALLAQNIVFTIAGHSVTATQADIAGWIELSPISKDKSVDVTVDSGKILQYINAIAKRYIQPPRARLVMNTDSGQVVLDPGANGVDVVNKDQTAANVAKNLLAGKGMNVDLPVQYAAAQTIEATGYPKWIVVDITSKRMYAYENTTLVRTFLVSAGAPATPTPTGRFAIYAKYVSQDMSGSNADGSRYFQPAVPWVNYFSGGDAIHGNYWRPSSWFGNINSSHGCVGVPVDDGQWIYDWAPIGTPVIVHS